MSPLTWSGREWAESRLVPVTHILVGRQPDWVRLLQVPEPACLRPPIPKKMAPTSGPSSYCSAMRRLKGRILRGNRIRPRRTARPPVTPGDRGTLTNVSAGVLCRR